VSGTRECYRAQSSNYLFFMFACLCVCLQNDIKQKTVRDFDKSVHKKTVTHCIRCHKSGKKRRILTKFYADTKTLNGKQVTKFQQNRSTSAIATTASLVRSLNSSVAQASLTVKCASVRMARSQHT